MNKSVDKKIIEKIVNYFWENPPRVSTKQLRESIGESLENTRYALNFLLNNEFLLKIGSTRTGVYWKRNTSFLKSKEEAINGYLREKPSSLEIAGPAYQPPYDPKNSYDKTYAFELNSLRRVAELARKSH